MLEIVKIYNYMQNKFVHFKFKLRKSNLYSIKNQFEQNEKNMQYHSL